MALSTIKKTSPTSTTWASATSLGGLHPWVLGALRKADIHEGTVVELGCGTGILLSALSGGLSDSRQRGLGSHAGHRILNGSRRNVGARLALRCRDPAMPRHHRHGRAAQLRSRSWIRATYAAQVFSQAAALPAGGLLLPLRRNDPEPHGFQALSNVGIGLRLGVPV